MPRQDYAHLSVDQILDGAVDPDIIAGDLLLYLMEFHNYTETAERLNSVRSSLNRELTTKNNMWQRVKNALKAQAALTPGVTWEQLKGELDQTRDRNYLSRGLRPGFHHRRARSSEESFGAATSRQQKKRKVAQEGAEMLDDIWEYY